MRLGEVVGPCANLVSESCAFGAKRWRWAHGCLGRCGFGLCEAPGGLSRYVCTTTLCIWHMHHVP